MHRKFSLTALAIGTVLTLSACGGSQSVDQSAVDKAVAAALAAQASASPAATSDANPVTTSNPSTDTAASPTPEPPESAAPSSGDAGPSVDFKMPNFVGMNLQDAQNKVQTYGVFYSKSHDLHGSRMQLFDSNWKVCDQNVKVGTPIKGSASDFEAKFDFGSVKQTESCP